MRTGYRLWVTGYSHWKLIIANSLQIASPALNPGRSSPPAADYETSRFSAGENCKLKITCGEATT